MTTSGTVPDHPARRHGEGLQLTLPFLTADDVATLDAAADAIQRATGHAVAGGRLVEADQLAALGDRLVDIIVRNADRHRGDQ